MDVSALKAQMQSNTLPNYLIFSGVEWKVQQLYIQQISKLLHKPYKYIDSIADVWAKITNKSFVSTSFVYVVRDDKDLLNNEDLWVKLEKTLGDNTLIMLLTNVDKRTKFYKHYKDSIVDFEPLKPAILKKYIQKDIALSDKNCETLMEVCEYSYGRCLLEIDKIRRYVDANS